jgi:phytoene synthase
MRPFAVMSLVQLGLRLKQIALGVQPAQSRRVMDFTSQDMGEIALLPATRDALKQADPDRFRAALLADPQRRDALLVLYAFHYELAKVPELVSEPMMGAIRYQWWREAIAEIYETDSVRAHEISTPLRRVLRDYHIPRFAVDRLIDGRERDLDPRPFADLAEARAYCEQTSGQLMQIAAQLCGAETDVNPAGVAWGLTGLARGYKYYHATILSELSHQDLVEAAVSAHSTARPIVKDLDSSAFPAVAYAALVPGFTKRLRAKGLAPKTDVVTFGPLAKQVTLFWATLRGRI